MVAGRKDMLSYRQCKLRKGTTETTGWIETRGAKVGFSVEINGEWWEVIDAYNRVFPGYMLFEHQKLNRHSLPSVKPIA
jgi:hypothetical protein